VAETVDIEIGVRTVAGAIKGHAFFAARNRHRADLAFWQIGRSDLFAGVGLPDLDGRSAVDVDRGNAILAVVRETGEEDVPVGFLNVAVGSG
jgi:hypothetical protein